jgi:hypothetical protein
MATDQHREREEEEDDYRHRMKMNVLGLLVTILLVISGVWIADSMAEISKLQNCILAGGRNCQPIGRTGEKIERSSHLMLTASIFSPDCSDPSGWYQKRT